MNDPKATPGARLKAEREQRGISVEKAANDMHLDSWAIDALEAGDYERIGPMVYAKGHLKRYASMLGLPADEIMSAFESPGAAPDVRERRKFPVGSKHTREPSRAVSPAQATASLAAALAFIGLAWWQPWDHRQRAKASSSAASTAAQARAAATGAEGDAMDGVAEPSADTPRAAAGVGNSGAAMNAGARTAASSGVGATAAATAGRAATDATPGRAATDATPGRAATDATAASPPARARLQLSFTSDSWVDVRDALGNQAFVGNGAANTVKTIAGAAPLHVYLRSASGVQLEINGRAVAIGAQFFSGDAARFQAGADGVLRREQTPARPPG